MPHLSAVLSGNNFFHVYHFVLLLSSSVMSSFFIDNGVL